MRRFATFLVALLGAVTPLAAGSAELEPDPQLASRLAGVLHAQGLDALVSRKLVAVSLVDVTDAAHPRYAGVNDTVMMYAASLPKIAILLAAMESVRSGSLRYTADVRDMLHNIARRSSNTDASKVVRLIGFETIANTLMSERYRLYDPERNGGLWVGKAYGGPSDYWRRDPLHNLSHGATSLQSARFFTLLAQGELAGPELCGELKAALARPGIHHKFVKGLAHVPGATIYRKSGTWRNWHSDAALVEYGGKRYVAVALTEDPDGGKILERLIGGLHEIICGGSRGTGSR